MSRYEDYQKKWQKIAAVKNFLLRNVIIISAVAAVALGAAMTLTFTKGMVIEGEAVAAKYIYGQELSYSASSFMGGASFEFAPDGTEDWTTVEPENVGNYKMRAVSTNSFGQPTYGQVHHFTIDPKEIEVAIPENSVQYGDYPTVVVSGLLPGKGHGLKDYSFAEAESPEDGKQSFTVDSISIENSSGEDVTRNYAFTLPTKECDIVKRHITVEAQGDKKTYDGQEMSSTAEITSGTLVEGDEIHFEYNSITEVGTVETLKDYHISHGEDDVTDSYDVSVINSNLVVEQKSIFIHTPSLRKTYDGTPFTVEETARLFNENEEEYSILDDGSILLPTGDKLTPDFGSAPTDSVPGTYPNAFEYELERSGNYIVNKAQGSLVIEPRPISIKVDINRNYEGTLLGGELTGDELYVSSGQLVSGHRLVGEVEESSFFASVAQRTFTYRILDDEDQDVTSYYAVTVDSKSIEFTPGNIKITPKENSKVYDGTALTGSFEVSGLKGDDKIAYTYSYFVNDGPTQTSTTLPTLTKPGKISYKAVSAKVTDLEGNDRTNYYDIETPSANIEIEKRPLAIELSGTRTYTGDEAIMDNLAMPGEYSFVAGTSLADGDSLSITPVNPFLATKQFNVSITNAELGDVKDCYDWNLTGDVAFEKANITISQNSATELEYDGAPHRMTAQAVGVLGSDTLVMSNGGQSPEYTNVGEYSFTPTVSSLTHQERYDVDISACSLKITKRPITIRVAYDRGTYNGHNYGTSLSNAEFEVDGGTPLISGHNLSVTCAFDPFLPPSPADLMDVTKYTPRITNSSAQDVTSNYDVSLSVVNAAALKAAAPSVSAVTYEKVYDGTPLVGSFTESGFVGDDLPVYSTQASSYSIADVGTLDYTPSVSRITENGVSSGSDKKAYYGIDSLADIATSGSLTVTKRDVEVTIYPHSDLDYAFAITNGSLADGQYLRCDATFTDGNIDYTLKITAGNQTTSRDVTSNYNVSKVLASNATDHMTLDVYYQNLSFTYDGSTHYPDYYFSNYRTSFDKPVLLEGDCSKGYWSEGVTSGDVLYGETDTSKYRVTSSLHSGDTLITSGSSAAVYNQDVTSFYNINVHQGTLNIAKRSLNIDINGSPSSGLYHSIAISNDVPTSRSADWYRITTDSYTYSGLAPTDQLKVYVRKDSFGPELVPVIDYDIENMDSSYVRNVKNGTASCNVNDCYSVSITGPSLNFASLNLPDYNFEYDYDATDHLQAIRSEITSDVMTKLSWGGNNFTLTTTPYAGKALESSAIRDPGDYTYSYKVTNITSYINDSYTTASVVMDQNYDLHPTDGVLMQSYFTVKIKQKVIDVNLGDYDDWYDGLPFQFSSYITASTVTSLNSSELGAGDRFSAISFTNAPTAAGVTNLNDSNVSGFKIVNSNNVDVTAGYTVTFHGSVNKRAINLGTISSTDASKIFDGTALSYGGTNLSIFSYDSAVFAELESYGFNITITATGTVGPNVGSAPNSFIVSLTRFGQAVTTFEYGYNPGTLTITQATIIVRSADIIIFEGDEFDNNCWITYNNSGISVKVQPTYGGLGTYVGEGEDEYGHYVEYLNDNLTVTVVSNFDASNYNVIIQPGTIRIYSV